MNTRSGVVLCAALSAVLASCSGSSVPTPSTTSASPAASASVPRASAAPTPTSQPAASSRPSCPNPGGGTCLGVLPAGTYSTATLEPSTTFTTPVDGWANYEDQPGNFLLVPPGFDRAGVDAGTSDYLGIYASLAPIASCDGSPATVKGAAAMAAFLRKQPALATTPAKMVLVGGLSGLSIDVRLARGWKHSCSGNGPDSGVITGLSPSTFEHGVQGRLAVRLYFLDSGDHVVGIEIDDVSGGGRLAGYDLVVKSLKFAPGG
jgi:hypothetical protein